LQCSWSLQRAIDQHAASSVGCFTSRLAAFDHQNAGPAPAQRDGKGEADDPSAYDDYVPTLHSGIVKDGTAAAPFRLPEQVTGKARLLTMTACRGSWFARYF
jgi:hypothetical protein